MTYVQKLEIVRLHNAGLSSTRIMKDLRRRGSEISRKNVHNFVQRYTQWPSTAWRKAFSLKGFSCVEGHNQFVKEGAGHSLSITEASSSHWDLPHLVQDMVRWFAMSTKGSGNCFASG